MLVSNVHGTFAQTPPPADRGRLLKQAREFTKKKKPLEALNCYSQMLELDANDFDALFGSGYAENEREQFLSALGFLEKARMLRPDHGQVWVELGFAHTRRGEADAAVEAYRAAIKINGGMVTAWRGLGDVYFDVLKDYPSALAAYTKVNHLRPSEPVSNYRLGWMYNKQGDYRRAEPYLRKVADHVLGYLPAQTELGFCYYQMHDFASAQNRYQRALKIDAQNKQAHYFLGLCYVHEQRLNDARVEVSVLAHLSPDLANSLQEQIQSPNPTR
jgi:tetratricopeptide (TPR) repeat protein